MLFLDNLKDLEIDSKGFDDKQPSIRKNKCIRMCRFLKDLL